MHRSIPCQVQGKSRFTNRRTSGKDDKVRALPAIGYFVEGWKPGWNTGDLLIPGPHLVNLVQGIHHTFAQRIKFFFQLIIGNGKQFLFRTIQQVKNIR